MKRTSISDATAKAHAGAEETVGKDLPPVPLRLLPAEPTRAALARTSRSARARQQASLTCQMSTTEVLVAFGKVHKAGGDAKGHGGEAREKLRTTAVTR